MASGRSKTKKEKSKKYTFELSALSLFLWSLCSFLFLGWIFVLGILVGRGAIGDLKPVAELKRQIIRLQELANSREATDPDSPKVAEIDPKFVFYDKLATKKEEVAERNLRQEEERSAPKPPQKTAKADAGRAYTVQIASLDDEIKAIRLVNRLNDRGYPAYYYETHIGGKTFFRVRCGRFKEIEEAQNYNKLLAKREGIAGFISKIEE